MFLQATSRLQKARAEEAECKRRVDAAHDGSAVGLSDSDIKRRTKNWSAASTEVTEAEAALQQAAGDLVGNRRIRDGELRNACRTLQVGAHHRCIGCYAPRCVFLSLFSGHVCA